MGSLNGELQASRFIAHKGRMRIFYLTCEMKQ